MVWASRKSYIQNVKILTVFGWKLNGESCCRSRLLSKAIREAEGIYVNLAIVGVLAVGFIVLGSLVTRWKEK